MGKFGKKVEISTNPLDYNICILGESKIGKTTIAKQMCEKLVGDDGYIHLDIGREEGAAAIEGIVSEHIEDWAKLLCFINTEFNDDPGYDLAINYNGDVVTLERENGYTLVLYKEGVAGWVITTDLDEYTG